MHDVFDAAAELQNFCAEAGWRFCFIGGLAVQRWGQPRFTRDADLTLLTGFGNEEAYVSSLLRRFQPRIENAAAFAVANRVLLLKSASGVGLDIALAGLPFEEAMIGFYFHVSSRNPTRHLFSGRSHRDESFRRQRSGLVRCAERDHSAAAQSQLEANPERAPSPDRAQRHSRNSRAAQQIP